MRMHTSVFLSLHTPSTVLNCLSGAEIADTYTHICDTHTSLWFHPQSSCTWPLHPSKRSISDSCPHRLLRPWGSLLWDMACHCLSGSVPHSPDTRTRTPSIALLSKQTEEFSTILDYSRSPVYRHKCLNVFIILFLVSIKTSVYLWSISSNRGSALYSISKRLCEDQREIVRGA
jgi:hypothetical protein